MLDLNVIRGRSQEKSKDVYQETTWAVGKLLVLKGEVLGGML